MFGISKRVVAVIFGLLVVAFAIGAILLFTPQGQQQAKGKVELTVNGKPIYETELVRFRSSDQVLSATADQEGVLKVLAEQNFYNNLVLYQAVTQDASRIRVSSNELRKELERIKQQLGITSDKQWQETLQRIGYTETQVRNELRDQIRINKRIEQVQGDIKPTEEQLKLFYELNKTTYRNDERVIARQIVVDDKATAQKLYEEAKAGADFAELAKKNSKVGADQSGALGAETGKSEPKPVTKVIFPTAVGEAVFKLKQGGITQPVESAGRYYIVKVEQYLPAGESSFEEVKDRVTEDVKNLLKEGALERYIEEVRAKAKVEPAKGSSIKLSDPVVAKVGDSEIKLSQVLQPAFANPQFPNFVAQGLGDLAVQFFLPQTLDQLITREVVLAEAKKMGQPFFGTKDSIVQQAESYQARGVTATDEEARKYYNENKILFTEPATATVTVVNFTKDQEAKAKAFRAAALKGGKLEDLAKAQGGNVQDYGVVTSGTLPPVSNKLVFETKATFPKSSLGEVSEVVKLEDGSFQVLLIKARTPERVKPFAEVAQEARDNVIRTKKVEAGSKWVESLKKTAKVENKLQEVLKQLTPPPAKKEEKPADPKQPGGQTAPKPEEKPATPAKP
ncbi:peptidylprolyl isomerase [Calidithermus chliarophilus]|uniref:peptidylprolyl isomerase n=1 Tax=Calidithermus chliarophilus TaxID=52023 RepID=UPI00040D7D13|nr:peptidylprolyl isomerase [Calidithermus chliarophilus]